MSAALDTSPEDSARWEQEARQAVWDAYEYETQEEAVNVFHASRARTKIVSCPARTSKSYASWKDVLPDILLHGARVAFDPDVKTQIGWIVAPNYVLAKEFDYAWTDLVENASRAGFNFNIDRKSNNVTQGDMQIVINWGKNLKGDVVRDIITVKSATNINVLQSEEVDWAILSEAARLPQLVWTKFLSTRVGRSIWPTTPDIQAVWIWDEIQKSSNPALEIASFNFTGKANPGYDWNRYWLEHMKTEMDCVFIDIDDEASDDEYDKAYDDAESKFVVRPIDMKAPPSAENGHDCFDDTTECRSMKADGFAEQFGGKWVFHRGRVVPLRETEGANGQPPHVIDFDLDWYEYARMDVSFDYGYSDGTCIGFWFIGGSQVVLYDSVYETEMTPDDVASEVMSKIQKIALKFNRDPKSLVRRYVGDPQQPAVEEQFRRRGIPIWPVDKLMQRSRKAGHLELMNLLKADPATGELGMLVHKRNREVIKEWSTLRRNDKVGEDAPSSLIGRDHAYDMARYFVMTKPISRDLISRRHKKSDFEVARQRILRTQYRERVVTVQSQYGARRVGGML